MWHDPTRSASSYDMRSAAGVGAAAAAGAIAAAAAAASGVASSSSPLLMPAATAGAVTVPCVPCHDEVGPMAYGASSGYAAALRRLARQAETAAGAGRGLQAIRGRGGVDDHRRLDTAAVRRDVAASTGSGAAVTTLHETESGKSVVAAVVGSIGDRRSNEDVLGNDGASLFSYPAAVAGGTPFQYATYLRSSSSLSSADASSLGASLIDEAATNFSSSSSSSSSFFPSLIGCWPNLAGSDAVAAAQLCLLRLMSFREALHPQQVQQQQQLLLQHLLAHTLLSSSSGAGATAGVVAPASAGAARSAAAAPQQQLCQQPPSGSFVSPAAKSSAAAASDGSSEPTGALSIAENVTQDGHILKQERKSPGDEDRVGFRPYSASNRCNGLVRNVPPPPRDDAAAPTSIRSGHVSPRPAPASGGSSHSKNVTPAESDMATHLDAARKQHLRKRVNVCSIRHRQPQAMAATAAADTLSEERDTFFHPMAVLPRPTPLTDGSHESVRLAGHSGVQECRFGPAAAMQHREPDGHRRPFSTLDLVEVRRQSRLTRCVENAASDDDENDEVDEAKSKELTQRRLVIRTPLVTPSAAGRSEPVEKRRLLAALGLAPVHEATEMKCAVINRRRVRLGMRSEPDDLEARLQSLSPVLDRLHASTLHAPQSSAKAPLKTCPQLEHVDKVEFLLQLGLCRSSSSSSNNGCNSSSSRSDRRSPSYSAHSAGDAGPASVAATLGLSDIDVTQLNA